LNAADLAGLDPELVAQLSKQGVAEQELLQRSLQQIMESSQLKDISAFRRAQTGKLEREGDPRFMMMSKQIDLMKHPQEIELMKGQVERMKSQNQLSNAQAQEITGMLDLKQLLMGYNIEKTSAEARTEREMLSADKGRVEARTKYLGSLAENLDAQTSEYVDVVLAGEKGKARIRDIMGSGGEGTQAAKLKEASRKWWSDMELKSDDAELYITGNMGSPESAAMHSRFNRFSNKPYMFIWDEDEGETVKVPLPVVGRNRLTAKKVYRAAKKNNMTVKDYLAIRRIIDPEQYPPGMIPKATPG